MTSRGQCPRGVCACECLYSPPPPFQEILYPCLDIIDLGIDLCQYPHSRSVWVRQSAEQNAWAKNSPLRFFLKGTFSFLKVPHKKNDSSRPTRVDSECCLILSRGGERGEGNLIGLGARNLPVNISKKLHVGPTVGLRSPSLFIALVEKMGSSGSRGGGGGLGGLTPLQRLFFCFVLVSIWKFPRTWTLTPPPPPPLEEFWPRTPPPP